MSHKTSLIAALILTVFASPAWAQRKLPFSPKATAKANAAQSAIDKEQDRKQRLNQARRNFTKAELAAMAAVSQEIAAAKAAHRAAVKEFQAARDSAEKSVETSHGMKKLQEDVAAAQKAYREAADPVLHALKGSTDYQAATKKAAAASAKIKELQDDSSLSDEDRKSQLQSLVSESLQASNLEREALRKEPRVNTAREHLESLQQKLADLKKRVDEKVENDSSVVAAQQAVKGAHASIQAAEAKLAAVEAKAAVGEQMLEAGVIPRRANPGNDQSKGNRKK